MKIDDYQCLEEKVHILKRPGMFIGSTDIEKQKLYVTNDENEFVSKNIDLSSGLLKIFDEALVNAIDHSVECYHDDTMKNVTKISISIDKKSGEIIIENNGEGIPIKYSVQKFVKTNYVDENVDENDHEKVHILIPEMIFSKFRSSSSFSNDKDKTTGSVHGYGVKLVSLFSNKFVIETCSDGQYFKQEFLDNMNKIYKPIVKKMKKAEFTRVTFLPDYKRFNYKKGLTNDIYHLMRKRCFDAGACTPTSTTIYFNEQKLPIKSFLSYSKLYFENDFCHMILANKSRKDIIENWELVVTTNLKDDDGFNQISFVNGICTYRGGTHVNYIINKLTASLSKYISDKLKLKTKVKPNFIRDKLCIFLKSVVINPNFNSQTKEELRSNVTKMGFSCDIPENYIKKISNLTCGDGLRLCDSLGRLMQFKEKSDMSKTDGSKKINLNIPKLCDAKFAGTTKSLYCSLILTEGDSALTTALMGRSEVDARYYGAFPLKGKLLNVRDESLANINKNEEISNLKKILGLQHNFTYETEKELQTLRYGHVIIFTDQDPDGSHIKGLVMNFISYFYPALLKRNGFLSCIITPIVKCRHNRNEQVFYNLYEYKQFINNVENSKNYKVKYYKGLATSVKSEAKEYFANLKTNQKFYKYTDDSDKSLLLGFDKKLADNRKSWLNNYRDDDIVEYKPEINQEILFEDFIHKELIHFSQYDLMRSLPNVYDGLKISQRKVLYSSFKRNLQEEIRVSQLSGYVSETSFYHHGEASLHGTIIKMAQDFVGSNNINLLMPNGAFGSRLLGGKDSGSPRYINSCLSPICKYIFNEHDSSVLNYLEEDGQRIEPEHYMPIIPLLLVNGCHGIGTGYSTKVLCYNPHDIITYLLNNVREVKNDIQFMPYYKGFKGKVLADEKDENKFYFYGTFYRKNDKVIVVTELPIGVWTTPYYEKLLKLLKKKQNDIINVDNTYITESKIHIEVTFRNKSTLDEYMKNEGEKIYNELYLKKSIKNNLNFVINQCHVRTFHSIQEIMNVFYEKRMEFYEKRKNFMLQKLEKDIRDISIRVSFIKGYLSDHIILKNQLKNDIVDKALNYINEHNVYRCEANEVINILNGKITTLTKEKIDKLCQKENEMRVSLNELKNTTIENMYENDLLELLKKL